MNHFSIPKQINEFFPFAAQRNYIQDTSLYKKN